MQRTARALNDGLDNEPRNDAEQPPPERLVARIVKVFHTKRHAVARTPTGFHVFFHELSVVGGLSILANGDEVALTRVGDGWLVRRMGCGRSGR